jgi:hypothetical protein
MPSKQIKQNRDRNLLPDERILLAFSNVETTGKPLGLNGFFTIRRRRMVLTARSCRQENDSTVLVLMVGQHHSGDRTDQQTGGQVGPLVEKRWRG